MASLILRTFYNPMALDVIIFEGWKILLLSSSHSMIIQHINEGGQAAVARILI